jgi:hypothetical protein
MRRFSKVLLVALGLTVITAQAALAANVHFKTKPPLTFTDNGLTLEATGALTGLGNGDLVIILSAQGQPIATCTNPGTGEHRPPGQNPAVATLTGVQQIPGSAVKNGNVDFDVSTGGPVTPVPGAPGCPNSNWREDITDVVFSGFSATITVYQGVGCAVDPSTGQPNSNCTKVFESTQTVP